VSGSRALPPRWLPQCSCVVIESSFDPGERLQAPFIKILFLLSQWFQTRRFLWEFPIGSYVNLSSAVVAIFVGGMKCRTQFWKGTTKGSFQQSLVEIGSVVSEENFFFKFHPPFSKIVSGSRALPPRWLPQCSCVVIESSFDPGERLQAPGSLWFILYIM
jgi:hypothetical protein